MHTSALGIMLFLLVQPSTEESGDFPETLDDEESGGDVRMAFQCFTKFHMDNINVFCNATNIPSDHREPICFKLCRGTCKTKKEGEAISVASYPNMVNICMIILQRSRSCKDYSVNENILPDPPLNLLINYNNQSEEYVFDIETFYIGNEYLKDKLVHEIVLRSEREEWPECRKPYRIELYKKCFETTSDLRVSKRNVEYSTKYEARVRSKPNGNYFKGSWSSWSKTIGFETDPETMKNDSGDLLLVTLSMTIVLVLLATAILIAVFWKRSIKSLVWPEIPDHKSTLEKLCKAQKKGLHISFNPDYFENMPINKIDYMKALVSTEDGLQISTDILMEKPLEANACNIISSPEEGGRTAITTTTHNGLSSHENATEPLGDNSLGNPNVNVAFPASASVSECTPSSDNCTVMTGPGAGSVPTCSDAVKQPNNEFKRLCWEDIYIAMSAFKTPSAAVKQVPHNIF